MAAHLQLLVPLAGLELQPAVQQANDRELEVPRGELLRITGSRRG
jgi:hypothetical protein